MPLKKKKTTKKAVKATPATKTLDLGEPRFPYTTEPQALRRMLAEIPKRPKPPKVTLDTLSAWNVSKNTNSRTAINVLKKLKLLDPSGVPTQLYVDFMQTGKGPEALGTQVKEVYRVLFENSHAPHNESQEELKKLFYIHTGGGADAMRLQIQTFKVLCEYSSFEGTAGRSTAPQAGATGATQSGEAAPSQMPPIRVDLHIHLPENKGTRDYEAIIQDIARYIYGRDIDRS